jgi:hypothetical protein
VLYRDGTLEEEIDIADNSVVDNNTHYFAVAEVAVVEEHDSMVDSLD